MRNSPNSGDATAIRRWSVVITSSREAPECLAACVCCALAASSGVHVTVDVMVNGNRELAAGVVNLLNLSSIGTEGTLRIWYLPVADKANALNQYLHRILPEAETTFFLDGYVQVRPDAFRLLDRLLASKPEALAASGVPVMGRSARRLRESMLKDGGLHGNLFAVRTEVCRQLQQRGFSLPAGTYRTDGLMGAVFCFGLDPAIYDWEPRRIPAHPEATWDLPNISWSVQSYFKRMVRQAQGRLENRAIREHLAEQRRSPESLPPTAGEMVDRWMAHFPEDARRLLNRNPLCRLGLRRLRRNRDWSRVSAPPELIAKAELAGGPGYALL